MVEMVNLAVFAPAATVTLAGKVAAVLVVASVTTIPPVGAGPLIVTVPVLEAPPNTELGETASARSWG
jgi:hypothetical protein